MTGANVIKLLQIIPTLAATISFVVLSLAFVHEWAFYYVIGGPSALTKEIGYILFIGPILLFTAYMGGVTEAAEALSRRESTSIGRLKNQYQERNWLVLRTLANGLIVRDLAGDRIQFLRWDDIGAFESTINQPNRNGLVCRVTGYLCHP